MYGWRIKTWKVNETEERKSWCEKNARKYQIREIFINDALAVEYRPLLHF